MKPLSIVSLPVVYILQPHLFWGIIFFVLIQITFFFKVHHLILVLPLGRDSRRNFCGLSWHPSKQCTYTTNEQLWWRSCPLHKSFHCQRDHRQTTGGLVGGEWGGTFRFLKEAGSRDSRRPGGGPCRRVFSTLHISCAAGKLQHPWASWKWLQTLFAKALYVMAICLFGVWALSHAVLRCAALQEVKGGNSYLTCTAERLQLTERCHFRRERSTPDCKHKNVSQGQDVQSHACPAGFFRATSYMVHLYTANTVQMIKLLDYAEDCYSEHCSVTLTIYPCWKCR